MENRNVLVLIVDRDSDELGELYALFDRQGYLVATRRTAIEALKYVAQGRPDLVLFRTPEGLRDAARFGEAIRQIFPVTRVMLLRRDGTSLATPQGQERLLAAVKGTLAQTQLERIVFEPALSL